MNTLAIFTTTRAEFGLFAPLINRIEKDNDLDYSLFVGGTHLKYDQGYTINEIQKKGYQITATFDYLTKDKTAAGLTKSLARETEQLNAIFQKEKFDYVCVLGDRYELLPIVQAAIIYHKPIIHIHGGEATQGAIDEQIRHMITKAAHIHFASCEEYAQNIRKMGEQPWRVFNTGALAVENMKEVSSQTDKENLFRSIGLDPNKKTVLMTYHPVTLESSITPNEQIDNVFKALKSYEGQVLVTAPNVDEGGQEIHEAIKKHEDGKNVFYVESLGAKKYLGMLKFVDFVIGNSSSGLLEVPYFRIPTINIGKRQQGRIRHESVIDTGSLADEIDDAIQKALEPEFREQLQNMNYKFGDGNASKKIVEAIKKIQSHKGLLIKKLDFPC